MNTRLGFVFAVAAWAAYVPAADVARVYVSLPSSRVDTYLVSDQNEWRKEGTVIAASEDTCKRPVAFVKAGPFFYALDQYQDADLGYFSIARYDAKGLYRGKLVEKYAMAGLKADNMAVSPDGTFLYVSCFKGGVLLRVSTVTGEVVVFSRDGFSNSRGCFVGTDGTIYVANRGNGQANAYSSEGVKKGVSYSLGNASGVACDDVAGRVYVTNNGGKLLVFDQATGAKVAEASGTGNAMGLAFANGRLVIGNWGGEIWSYDPSANTLTKLFTGLGYIQHLHVEPIVSEWSWASTFSFDARGSTWYVAEDGGTRPTDASPRTTVWASSDRGASWTRHSEVVGLCRPSIYGGGTTPFLFGEAARAVSAEEQTFCGKLFGTAGWTDSFSSILPGTELVTGGGTVTAPALFGGQRVIFPLAVSGCQDVALFSTLKPGHHLFPDVVSSTTNTDVRAFFNGAEVRANKNAYKISDVPAVFEKADQTMMMFVPAELVRTEKGDRVPPEFVTMYTNWWSKNTPTYVGTIPFPGGAKPFSVVWDPGSACYWAVSTPVINRQDVMARDPATVRNVLALSASTNLLSWTVVKIVRAEGTPETVAFNRPCLAMDGDDLVLVYGQAGAYDPSVGTHVTPDGSLVCQRVANFRALKAAMHDVEPVSILQADFQHGNVLRYVQETETGTWMAGGVFAGDGQKYDGKALSGPVGLATGRRNVYVSCESAKSLFVFTKKGVFRARYAMPDGHKGDAVAVSADEKTAWVTDLASTPNAILKLDLETGVWTELVSSATDETMVEPRGLAVASDGSFYVASRSNGWIRRYAADGTTYTTVSTAVSVPIALALDEQNGFLYCGTRYGQVVKIALTDGYAMTELTEKGKVLGEGAFSIACHPDGLLYITDTFAGLVFTLDPDRVRQTPVPVLGGGLFWGRSALLDLSPVPGGVIFIR